MVAISIHVLGNYGSGEMIMKNALLSWCSNMNLSLLIVVGVSNLLRQSCLP